MKTYPHYRILLAIFTVMTLGVCLFPSNTHALTLTPARFEISGNPGQILHEQLLLINDGDGPQTYYPSYANFEAQGDSGSPAFVDPKDDLGTWMATGEPSVFVSAGQQKTVPFTVMIPKDAEPGGHFAVIFWGLSQAGQGQVSVGAKTGALVLLTVSGDVKQSAGLLNFNTTNNKFWYNTLPVSFTYRFKNDGGDRIKPVGTISLLDTIFLPADKIDANPVEGNVLPNSTRRIDVDWVKYERPIDYVAPTSAFKRFWSDVAFEWRNFAIGLYSAHLNVSYGSAGATATKTIFFFVFPWQLALVIILVLIIVLWGGKLLIKRYNRFIIERAKAGMKLPSDSSNDKFSI